MEAATMTRREEMEAEAGEPVGDMPPETPEAAQKPPPDEVLVDGTTQLALFDAGGKAPTRATIKFTGGKVKLVSGTAFRKGDRIRFSGEAVVNVIELADEHDPATGIVVDCEQRHSARIIDLQVDSAE